VVASDGEGDAAEPLRALLEREDIVTLVVAMILIKYLLLVMTIKD
jgi:hypothetical protein